MLLASTSIAAPATRAPTNAMFSTKQLIDESEKLTALRVVTAPISLKVALPTEQFSAYPQVINAFAVSLFAQYEIEPTRMFFILEVEVLSATAEKTVPVLVSPGIIAQMLSKYRSELDCCVPLSSLLRTIAVCGQLASVFKSAVVLK